MNRRHPHRPGLFLACLVGVALPAIAQGQHPTKATIGVHSVEITPSVQEAVAVKGGDKVLSLNRVADSMAQQLIDQVHNTRKFSVVSRSDLNTILKDQDLQRVLSDPSDIHVAQAFKVAGCKYALIVTVDDFQDLEQELLSDTGAVLATKRTVRLSSVAKIYDTTTGVLLESANFQLAKKAGKKRSLGVAADGKDSDELLTGVAREMAYRVSQRVLDVIFPGKIIAKTGKMVTMNRGDGTGIAKGQLWTVYALGEAMIDPDTGESLGAEEVPVGTVKITAVTPKFSRGEIVEDYGVDKFQVVRMDVPASEDG